VSKAFTSEETPDAAPLVRAPPRLSPGEVRYVTPEGQAALRAEVARLAAERAQLASLPETERRPLLAELDARAAVVEATLAALTVLGPEAAPEGRVAFARWVTVEDEAGARRTWRIVGPDESDPRRGLLSVDSPVGRALLGCAAGDEVRVERPGGETALRVVEIRGAVRAAP
jgi:transcription elongation factor GreB